MDSLIRVNPRLAEHGLTGLIFPAGNTVKKVRDRLLQQMPIAEQRRRGLRFSDEPVTNGPSPAEIQAMSDADAENPRRFGVNAQVVVAVLFHYADPLLLELAADMITNGVNLAFNGERCSPSPTIRPATGP